MGFTRVRVLACLSIGTVCCTHLDIQTDYCPKGHFSAYRTFLWSTESLTKRAEMLVDSNYFLFDIRVRKAIETELQKKGLAFSGNRKPDLIIRYYTYIQDRFNSMNWNAVESPYIQSTSSSPWSTPEPYQFSEGSFIVDLVDQKTGEVIWRAMVDSAINDVRVTDDKIQKLVEKLFLEYPPLI